MWIKTDNTAWNEEALYMIHISGKYFKCWWKLVPIHRTAQRSINLRPLEEQQVADNLLATPLGLSDAHIFF